MLSVALLTATAFASAQPKFPDGTIKLIVPFAAGGGVDNAARLLAKQMQANLNISIVVENKPGASGTIGAKFVQASTPDGQTLLFSASTQALTKLVIANPPYDPLTDFSYVARVGEAPLLMVIAPTLPQTKLKEVMDAAKQNPDKWTAGIPALGAASHLATLMFAKEGNLNLTMTAYKGTAPALTDVAGGHSQILIDSIISLQSMAKAGKVKPIIVTSAKRSSVMPSVPTASESGYPKFVTESWYGIWAPKGTPDDRVQLLNKAANEAVRQLTKSGAFEQLGIEPVVESVDQFKKYTGKYITENAELLKGAGFKPE
ncbi:MFS transporter [Limnohabitans sp. INBF002]|nr:MFS transporter [Limnohabitans sp. INBF002]